MSDSAPSNPTPHSLFDVEKMATSLATMSQWAKVLSETVFYIDAEKPPHICFDTYRRDDVLVYSMRNLMGDGSPLHFELRSDGTAMVHLPNHLVTVTWDGRGGVENLEVLLSDEADAEDFEDHPNAWDEEKIFHFMFEIMDFIDNFNEE